MFVKALAAAKARVPALTRAGSPVGLFGYAAQA